MSSVKKDEKPTIVVYHNDLNTKISLASLTPAEIDIFFAIIAALRYQRLNRPEPVDSNEPEAVTLTFDQLKSLSKFSQRGYTRFKKYLIDVYEKILSLHFIIDTEDSYTSFNLFSLFKVWDNKVQIVTNADRAYILESLNKNFTMMDLRMITEIPTASGKNLARILSQYRNTGTAYFQMDGEAGLRKQLGIENMEMRDITRRVIKPSVKLISKYFEGLDYEYVRDKTGYGRKVKAVKFTFKPGRGKYAPDIDTELKKVSEGKLEVQTCPICGEPLYQKVINGTAAWCHPDNYKKEGKCQAIFNTVAEIYGYEELPQRDDSPAEAETVEKNEDDLRYAAIVHEMIEKSKKKKDVDTNDVFNDIKERLLGL